MHTGSPDGKTFITISSEPEALLIKGKLVRMLNRYIVTYIVNAGIIKLEEAASR